MNDSVESTVDLHAYVAGEGEPMVFLHGLFGSWQNLATAVRAAAQSYQVHALDLRNHGKSPHHVRHNYPAMAADVASYIDKHIGRPCKLLGHSMGGKAAMQLALSRQDLVEKLVVVDIAPREYLSHHEQILAGLAALQGQRYANRSEADKALTEWVPELAIRSFLMKNLSMDAGIVGWRLNLAALTEQYPFIAGWPATDQTYAGPVLFLKGANSDYLSTDDKEAVLRVFPRAQLKSIAATGHWPHAEKPAVFNKLMLDFLA